MIEESGFPDREFINPAQGSPNSARNSSDPALSILSAASSMSKPSKSDARDTDAIGIGAAVRSCAAFDR